jgi:hypothetical protein
MESAIGREKKKPRAGGFTPPVVVRERDAGNSTMNRWARGNGKKIESSELWKSETKKKNPTHTYTINRRE